MLVSKKEKQEKYKNLYLNYGLLGLCTKISEKYPVTMYQGDYNSPQSIIDKVGINEHDNLMILLSVPSFLSLEWAVEFAEKVKNICPSTYIICGGRWVIDNNLEFIKKKFKKTVDFYSLGCPDDNIIDIIEGRGVSGKRYEYTSCFSEFDYSLLSNYSKYQPVIEVARGCGSGCDFCLESKFRVCCLKLPENIFREIDEIIALYNDEEINFYFEASIFLPTIEWSKSFLKLYKNGNYKFNWRCTTRVDRKLTEQLCILSQAGLKVVDYGLESGSEKQLLNMGKTTNPLKYLNQASELLKSTCENGIWNKCNILLYAGETEKTFEKTYQFLDGHRNWLKGISANPLTIYLNGDNSTLGFIKKVEEISNCQINKTEIFEKGFSYVDLSEEISKEKAYDMCHRLENDFMAEKDYLDLKSVCYTERKIS